MSKPDYLKYDGRIPEPPYETQTHPRISAERGRDIYRRNSIEGRFNTRWMTYDQFLAALSEAGVTVEGK